jgi:hypothetical protein
VRLLNLPLLEKEGKNLSLSIAALLTSYPAVDALA